VIRYDGKFWLGAVSACLMEPRAYYCETFEINVPEWSAMQEHIELMLKWYEGVEMVVLRK
jgi:hypothetical protein